MDNEDVEEARSMRLTEAMESNTHDRTTDMMSYGLGQEQSLASLTKVIGCVDDTDQEAVQILLLSKRHISGSEKLLELVHDYFRCSDNMIEFLQALHEWLHGGSGVIRRINRLKSALEVFKEEKSDFLYVQTAGMNHALESFINVNDPLAIEILRAKLSSILEDQKHLCEQLEAKKYEVDHKNMRRYRVYRRLNTAVHCSVYTGLLACTIATSILTPPVAPLVALAAAASMNPTDPTRTWMKGVLNKYKDKIMRRGELLNELMENQTPLVELMEIHLVVQALRNNIQSFSVKISPVIYVRKDSVVNYMIMDMEEKVDEFGKAVNHLESIKHKCYENVINAREKIRSSLKKIFGLD